MEIWPAIDLCGGKCVRLVQGDYDRQTIYADDPVEVARHWVELGAQRLHLVDLDGARDGSRGNWNVARAIVEAVEIPCQLGGGIRDEETIARLLEAGLSRLVIGTRAAKDPDWFGGVCRRFPGQLVAGIDARDGRVATDGWQQVVDVDAVELALQLSNEPLAAVVYTDIAQDGMLQGPNLEAMKQMQQKVRLPVIASGGVTTLEDVQSLAEAGLAGCIVGKALYEGRLSLPDILDKVDDQLPQL